VGDVFDGAGAEVRRGSELAGVGFAFADEQVALRLRGAHT